MNRFGNAPEDLAGAEGEFDAAVPGLLQEQLAYIEVSPLFVLVVEAEERCEGEREGFFLELVIDLGLES